MCNLHDKKNHLLFHSLRKLFHLFERMQIEFKKKKSPTFNLHTKKLFIKKKKNNERN